MKKGFFLLELLLGLGMLLILLPAITLGLRPMFQSVRQVQDEAYYRIELDYIQSVIREDVERFHSTLSLLPSDWTFLTRDGDHIRYSIKGNRLRRQKNSGVSYLQQRPFIEAFQLQFLSSEGIVFTLETDESVIDWHMPILL